MSSLAVVAAAVAVAMIVNDYENVIDVFELADPTGSFGTYLHIGGLAANLAVIFVAACVLLPASQSRFRSVFAAIVFIPSVLEAIAALPCLLPSHPGALCGLGVVVVADIAVPVVIAAAFAFVATSRLRATRLAGLAVTVVFIGLAAAAQLQLAPQEPGHCRAYAEVTKRSTCLNAFAGRLHDETICRSIEFRSTRFTCLREVAVAKRQPRLCDEIKDTGPIAAYESSAAFFRDACFQSLAYQMHDRSQCGGVADPQLRASCENGVH
jgi:hypothetical protein